MFAPEHLEAAVIEQILQIALAVVNEMARDVDAVPMFSEDEKLPGRGVRDLDDEAAAGREQTASRAQVPNRIVDMLQHVEHRHQRENTAVEWRMSEIAANHGNAVLF